MTSLDGFRSIIPLHQKILDRLIAQRRVDPLGAIGWGGPLEDLGATLHRELIYEPLLGRGMVEDCTLTELGAGGKFFVRITDFGVLCSQLGVMPIEAVRISVTELKRRQAAHLSQESKKSES